MAGNDASSTVELIVAEAPESDVGLGRARIDEAARRLLGLGTNDILEIVAERQTLALAHSLLPEDEGKGIIRIDGLVGENAKASRGDKVTVRRAHVSQAREIELAPIITAGHKISFGQGIENFIKRGLLGRPIRQGDTVIVPGIALMGGAMPFRILRTIPGGNLQVQASSVIKVRETPFRKREALSPEEILEEFVDRIVESLSSLLAEYGDQLAALPGETGEKARSINSRIRAFLWDFQGKDNPPP